MESSLLIGKLPPFQNNAVLVQRNQTVYDIINEVLDAHDLFRKDYDNIATDFWTGDIETTAKKIFDFLKRNVRYKIETEGKQTTKSPAAMLATAIGDCKHYASFINGLFDAINRKYNQNINWFYRFASYNFFDKEPAHVFAVAKKNGKEIWCLGSMNCAKKLRHPLQILYLENSIIYLDELQRFYPSDHSTIDEVTHHIISTHRHSKNIIHWSSQAWEFVHPFWRRETSYCWRYRPLFRDPATGESRIKRHRRSMVTGLDMELHRRQPDILTKDDFWISKKLISRFDSYDKMDVAATDFSDEQATMDLIAKIRDPRHEQSAGPPNFIIEPLGDQEGDNNKNLNFEGQT